MEKEMILWQNKKPIHPQDSLRRLSFFMQTEFGGRWDFFENVLDFSDIYVIL